MYADQIDNEYRREIFLKLCKAKSVKYSKLKADGMESNQFAYHLKKLKDDGFIEKLVDCGEYTLAPKGLRLADTISHKTGLVRTQPKVLIVFDITSADGKRLLNGTRERQPHFGKKVLPSGKIHFGETIEAAATRMLKEFLPDSKSMLSHRGNFSLFYTKGKVCVSHIYAHVYSARLSHASEEDIPKKAEDMALRLFWEDISKIKLNDEWVDGVKEIQECLRGNDFFEMELEFSD